VWDEYRQKYRDWQAQNTPPASPIETS